MQILICDDDKIRSTPLIDTLRLLGHEATLLTEAASLPPYLDEHRNHVDVVLLDLLMSTSGLDDELTRRGHAVAPGASAGVVLYDYIRRASSIPVVIHSVLRDTAVRRYFEGRGVRFLEKPATLTEVVAALMQAAGGSNG
jgi:CheY-like chemotaxis protein